MKTPIISDISRAAALIKKGHLVAFPTETVYGLGASIWSEEAIKKIFLAKMRPADNPLIAHLASTEEIQTIAEEIPDVFFKLAAIFSPGPLTYVLRKQKGISDLVSKETIAFRIPSHPTALELIREVGAPLVAPSANLSGRPSPTKAIHVLEDLDGKIEAILDGGSCEVGIESTVISLLDPKKPLLLRPGSIEKEEIEEILHLRLEEAHESMASPGTRYKHYQPKAKVFIFNDRDALRRHVRQGDKKRRIEVPTMKNLYATMREADLNHCEEICFIIEKPLSKGLLNRLERAASK